MTPLLYFAGGLIVGLVVVTYLSGRAIGVLEEQVRYLREESKVATDRLVHAWREDKAIIPPRPIAIEPPKPLPPELAEVVAEWESPETRAAAEAELRRLYFDKQWGVQAILKHLQNQGL